MNIRYSGKIAYNWNKQNLEVKDLLVWFKTNEGLSKNAQKEDYNCTFCFIRTQKGKMYEFYFNDWNDKFKNKKLCDKCIDRFLNLPGNEELVAFILAYEMQKT